MRRRIIQILFFPFFIFLLFGISACEKTYSGKIIDANTKEPIEGAVVVATWLEGTAKKVDKENSRLKDIKETLTDKNGEWAIIGPRGQKGGNITAIYTLITGKHYTRPPLFIIFKPGYCSWPNGFQINACKKMMKGHDFSKNKSILKTIELPKLANRENRLMAQRIWPSMVGRDKETAKKIVKFINLLNKERRYLGLSELSILKDLEDEK